MPHNFEIRLDNNLSPILTKWLSEELNMVIKSSYVLNLFNLTDFEIYSKAKENGNVILISKDSDLEEIISINGAPPNLIYLKIGNCDNKNLFEILKKEIPLAIKLMRDFNKEIIEIQN